MTDCPSCGFPVEQDLREAADKYRSVVLIATHCKRCGHVLDPPVRLRTFEVENTAGDDQVVTRKILD